MITNGFLNQISYFHEEDEVLFFPFSSFELVDVYEDETRTFIELDYSTRFLKKVEKCIYFKQKICLKNAVDDSLYQRLNNLFNLFNWN